MNATQEVQVYDGEVVDESNALAPYEGTGGLAVSADELKHLVELDEQKRGIINAYIRRNLKSGVDYGTIPVGGSKSKPSLFKPGAEKICMLLQLRASFQADHATLAMAGNAPGLFAYICLLTGRDNQVWGEGRGSADLSEKRGWTVNNAVKIAEKRAMIDAVLRVAAGSEMFSQDMEDQSQRAAAEYEQRNNGRQNGAQQATEQTTPMIGGEQIQEINRLLPLVPMALKDLLDSLAIKSLRELTEEKATRVIDRLKNKVPANAPAPVADSKETLLLIEQQRVRLKLGGTDWKALVRARNGGLTLEQMQPAALVTFLAWLRKQDTENAKAFVSSPDAWVDTD